MQAKEPSLHFFNQRNRNRSMPTPKNDNRYRPIRKGKRDYRSMVTDIVAFEHKMFMITSGLRDEIQYSDLKFLLALERLTIRKKKSVSVLVLSSCTGYSFYACMASLRRIEKNGLVIRITPVLWDATAYGSSLISRYNRTFNRFLSGKLQLPAE